jgi:hypothetical protein
VAASAPRPTAELAYASRRAPWSWTAPLATDAPTAAMVVIVGNRDRNQACSGPAGPGLIQVP